MASKANPRIKVTLDKPRIIMFDLNALAAFEETTGRSVLNGLSLEGLAVKDLRALFWAGLLHEDPDLTLQQVGAIVHPGNLMYIFKQINIAMGLAMPDAKEGDGDASRPLIMK